MNEQAMQEIRALLAAPHPAQGGLDAAQAVLRRAAAETTPAPAEATPEPPRRPWALFAPGDACPIAEGGETEIWETAHAASFTVIIRSPYGCIWEVRK